MRNFVELNTSFELANPVRDNVTIKDQAKFKQMVEICSALFTGNDAGKYGTQKDAVAKKLAALGGEERYNELKALESKYTFLP